VQRSRCCRCPEISCIVICNFSAPALRALCDAGEWKQAPVHPEAKDADVCAEKNEYDTEQELLET
jgi:hypothetical protein